MSQKKGNVKKKIIKKLNKINKKRNVNDFEFLILEFTT
jgi:hypothetical protein